jgi:hypothetical protein
MLFGDVVRPVAPVRVSHKRIQLLFYEVLPKADAALFENCHALEAMLLAGKAEAVC